ncbi:MAG: LacI family DNA-binding transcriptional regulator [Clostridia bacterium]|nr:LacI family DNA-binding transcriptional regulator [Clostridia bacterium]
MTASKKTTIKDVAKKAGVSVTTVSLVLNGKGISVPESTKERIYRAAEELRYTPNFTARSLVMGRTNMIGVVVPAVTNVFFAELVRSLQKEFSFYGYDIVLCNNEETAEKDSKYISLLAGKNIDGLIVAPGAESLSENKVDELKETLSKLHIPYLFLDRYVAEFAPRVSVDNRRSAYVLADYLLKKGHKKIGVITGPMQLNSSFNRLKGFRERFAEEGLDIDEDKVFVGRYDVESGEKAAQELLKTDVTAICAFSDMQAYGVYKKVKELGKRVPEDISVVGFDDNVYSSLLDKPLTTMRQPIDELAAAAVEIMTALIERKEVVKTRKFPARLIERESVKTLNE